MSFQDNIIGENLAKARKRKHLSQAQVAEQVFVSAQAVGKWERGESLPDLLTLHRVAELLEVDLNYFLDGALKTTEQPTPDSVQTDTNEIQSPVHASTSSKPIRNLSEGNWNGVDFSAMENIGDSFSASNLLNSKFSRAKLGGLNLERNNVSGCDFSDADLNRSRISKSFYSNDIFTGCVMQHIHATHSYFSECDFSQADWSHAKFENGGMEKCIVATTVLDCTVFAWMRLSECVFSGDITDCIFENCKFAEVTFQDVVFTNTFFKCRSLKHIRFIDCYADRLSFETLRNGGAQLDGLQLRY